MPSQSDYVFPGGGGRTGLDSLRIKRALVDGFLANKINNVVNNQLKNPSFYESVARQLVAGYLPPFDDQAESKRKAIEGRSVSLSEAESEDFITESGLFSSALVIPNLTFISTYEKKNFFNTDDNIRADDIEIDVPLCTMSYSFSNKYVESTPVGYNGTIKELVGSSNISVTIEGVFTARYLGQDPSAPAQNMPNVSDFQKMCMRNRNVTILSDNIASKTALNDFFENMVIKNFSLPGDNTRKNIQRFSLTLETDKNINLSV